MRSTGRCTSPCLRKNKGSSSVWGHTLGERNGPPLRQSRGSCARRGAPPPLFLAVPKRECAAPGGREKALRRGGLRQRRLLRRRGMLALPCRSQGRKRTALGESLGPGRFRDTPASLSAAAHASAENQPARSDAERAKREAGQCDLAPRRPPHHPPRDGSYKLAEGKSVPEGRPKSALAPIRRPPSRGGPLHRSASKRPFLLDRARPVFFSARPKRKWGVHCPAIIIAAIPRPMGRTPNTPAPEHRICPVAYTIPR